MTATQTVTWTGPIDAFTLGLMREAKTFRDANPEPEYAETDAYFDALLVAAEAAYAGGRRGAEPDAQEETPRPAGNGGNGASNYGGQAVCGASEPQQRFIRSLARDLGYDEDTTALLLANIPDRGKASKVIDALKAEVAKARREGTAAPRPERPATEGQTSYLTDLLATRVHGYGDLDAATVSFDRASALITELRNAPRAAQATAAHGIREGRYAYQPEGAQAIFLRVSRTGRVYTQAGPAEHPYRGTGTPALLWIAENQKEAAALYGQLIGSCGRCGRELTDEDSRARGLGPICAGKEW